MAATTQMVSSSLLVTLVFSVLSLFSPVHANPLLLCRFNQIYQLGDSLSDTGNLIREAALGANTPFAKLPYGETFFKAATGRCSNGLLMIDYFARAAGLPFLTPYKETSGDFRHGVNFAVAGATALSVEYLAKKNILTSVSNSSLDVQLDWMSKYFNSTCCTARDCQRMLRTSLFMVGEIGVNDYNFALTGGKTIEEIKDMVPDVVHAIADAVRTVIRYGAIRVVVPGIFPVGCLPICLTAMQTNNSIAYDEYHCLKEPNNVVIYHNNLLKKAIKELKHEFPYSAIVYADYYNAFQWLFTEASSLGFDGSSLNKACCGVGGDYNFNLAKTCGAQDVTVCSNPDQFISWDGIHLTQRAYMFMAKMLIHNILPKLHCFI
ncbi:acetylajmalan esterase-like [Diospyros lotus]|uniref:acetylajmalan esterase-like n=1 Tax=Diospyros lotus TaxID=55363 RepID=UPI0022558EB6|nr:acetylajmalan esterase-like [Diospyros lotus]